MAEQLRLDSNRDKVNTSFEMDYKTLTALQQEASKLGFKSWEHIYDTLLIFTLLHFIQNYSKMSILQKLGLTKESISKLLGMRQTVEKPKRKLKPKLGRPTGRHIDQSVVDAVRKASDTYTLKELSKRYNVSEYWVWSVRHGKLRVK